MWERLQQRFSQWDVDKEQREVTAYGPKPGRNDVIFSKVTSHPCLTFGLKEIGESPFLFACRKCERFTLGSDCTVHWNINDAAQAAPHN